MGVREDSGLEGLWSHGRAPDGGTGQPEQLPRRVGQARQLGLLPVGSHQALIRSRMKGFGNNGSEVNLAPLARH